MRSKVVKVYFSYNISVTTECVLSMVYTILNYVYLFKEIKNRWGNNSKETNKLFLFLQVFLFLEKKELISCHTFNEKVLPKVSF